MLYDRPLWELMADAVAAMPDRFAPADVVAWFRENYPGFKDNALRAHVVGLTANDPSRRHHLGLAPKPPLFFKLDPGVLTAFDPDRHGEDIAGGHVRGRSGVGSDGRARSGGLGLGVATRGSRHDRSGTSGVVFPWWRSAA
jgi:hypothetical protein